jgi:hypothetical protein
VNECACGLPSPGTGCPRDGVDGSSVGVSRWQRRRIITNSFNRHQLNPGPKLKSLEEIRSRELELSKFASRRDESNPVEEDFMQ